MLQLKTVDRVAIAAMLVTVLSIPLAGHAAPDAPKSHAHVLQDGTFQSIVPGMRSAEVLALIGAPHGKERFAATRTTAWDYRYRDSWGYDAVFSVIVGDDDRVVSKISVRKDAG